MKIDAEYVHPGRIALDVDVIHGNRIIIQATGEVDLGNVGPFADALRTAAQESPEGFVVDLAGVTYMDSAGIQAILAAYRLVRNAGGTLVLVMTHPGVREIFGLIGADRFPSFLICKTLDEGERALDEARHQ